MTLDNKIDGASIVLVDINSIRRQVGQPRSQLDDSRREDS